MGGGEKFNPLTAKLFNWCYARSELTKREDTKLKQIQRICTFLYSLISQYIHFKVNSFLHNSVVTGHTLLILLLLLLNGPDCRAGADNIYFLILSM